MHIIFFSPNHTGPLCRRDISVCLTAEDRKTDWKCRQCSELCARTTVAGRFTRHATVAKNNLNTGKFHSHLCTQLYFIFLKKLDISVYVVA